MKGARLPLTIRHTTAAGPYCRKGNPAFLKHLRDNQFAGRWIFPVRHHPACVGTKFIRMNFTKGIGRHVKETANSANFFSEIYLRSYRNSGTSGWSTRKPRQMFEQSRTVGSSFISRPPRLHQIRYVRVIALSSFQIPNSPHETDGAPQSDSGPFDLTANFRAAFRVTLGQRKASEATHGLGDFLAISSAWQPWEKYFTVVQWDQRGTGRTLLAVCNAAPGLARIFHT